MSAKISKSFSIDEDVYFKFKAKIESAGENMDTTIENFMRLYNDSNVIDPLNNEYVALTEKLLDAWKYNAIGKLANNVLRKLLESGVATDWEISEFQKARGAVQVNRLEISFGNYVSENFNLPFPLLITPEHLQYDTGKNFYVNPLYIDGNEYYLCSQWVGHLHRKKMESWIRKRLPKWFEETDEYNRNKMISWIENFKKNMTHRSKHVVIKFFLVEIRREFFCLRRLFSRQISERYLVMAES